MYATGRPSNFHFLAAQGSLWSGRPFPTKRIGGIRGLERHSGFLCPPICCKVILAWWYVHVSDLSIASFFDSCTSCSLLPIDAFFIHALHELLLLHSCVSLCCCSCIPLTHNSCASLICCSCASLARQYSCDTSIYHSCVTSIYHSCITFMRCAHSLFMHQTHS